MQGMFNMIRGQVLQILAQVGFPRRGLVTSYDPNTYTVKVQLQPDGTETGWLQLASPWIGNGWGLHIPPSIGDDVEVHFQEGRKDAGYVCQRFYNDVDRPLPCPSGEFWLVHKSGSSLKFTNTGDVLVSSNRDLTATVGRNLSATVAGAATLSVTGNINSSAPAWTHTGNLTVNGTTQVNGALGAYDINFSGTLTGPTIIGGGKNLATHIHTDPQGGFTGAPV